MTPAALSPVLISGSAVPLPYGLTWDDLGHCLPEFGTGEGARAWRSYEKQGLHGGENSQILTLSYPALDGRPRKQTLFLKRIQEHREAAKYQLLLRRSFPVPRLLHTVERGETEILVIEFLPTIGIEPHQFGELLRLIARLNAINDVPAEVFALRPGLPGDVFDGRVRAALADFTDAGTEYFAVYKRLEPQAARLPLALNHGEFGFQQIGRTESGRLVMFDLDTMGRRARFTDVATILTGLADLTGQNERELFARYLAELTELAGLNYDETEAWQELRVTRAVRTFEALPWLATTIDVAAHRADVMRQLDDDLTG
jgi:hypothetical protein